MAPSKFATAATVTASSIKHTTPSDGIRAFFFDLDNTLIPTRAGDSKAVRKLADVLETQHNLTKDDANLATQNFLKSFRRCPDNSQTSLDSWRTHLWRESLQAKHKHLAEEIYQLWLKLRYRYLAIPAEYVQLLQRMRQARYALALITNGPSNAQREKVTKLRVRDYFDCVLVSSDLPWEKPHPEIFYAACNFLNVKPHECAMIGDKLETDIKGGHLAKLGLTFWTPLTTASQCLDDVKYKPHIVLNNLLELYKYFPRLNISPSSGPGSAPAGPSTTSRRASYISSSIGSGAVGSSGHTEAYQRSDCSNSEAENSCDSIL